MKRFALGLALIGATVLAACSGPQDLANAPKVDLGAFELNVNYAFAGKAISVGHTRKASETEWTNAVKSAVQARLGRYNGGQPYDIGISVEGYTLGEKGIPLIYNPISSVVVLLNVYDPSTKTWLIRGRQVQVFENTDSDSLVQGSGGSRTKKEQIYGLTFNLAKEIEVILREGQAENGWFAPLPADQIVAFRNQ